MVSGIGIDSIEIERFSQWADYPHDKLAKTFSKTEIAYCLSNKQKSAERFAARFAVREALFKALSQALPGNSIPFFTVCQNICVSKESNGNPILQVNWENILTHYDKKPITGFRTLVSITHTKKVATAIVLCDNIHGDI
ncbi:holo-ACP synthase [Candidatus Dependentiae bacterium]